MELQLDLQRRFAARISRMSRKKKKNIDWSHEGLTSVGNIEKGVRRFQTGPQAGPTVWNVNELLATAENRQGEIRCKAKEANDHNEMNGK